MAQEATDQNLRDSLRGHIDQTEQQIRNLEQVYGQLGQEPQRLTSEGAQGLVSEAQQSSGRRGARPRAIARSTPR